MNTTTTLTWTSATDNMEGGIRYNVYASHTYPVDTDNPNNLVKTYLTDTCYTYEVTPYLPMVHYAVTAIDRCGNESVPAQIETKKELPFRGLEELKQEKKEFNF